MNARDYTPETGRFICKDTYRGYINMPLDFIEHIIWSCTRNRVEGN